MEQHEHAAKTGERYFYGNFWRRGPYPDPATCNFNGYVEKGGTPIRAGLVAKMRIRTGTPFLYGFSKRVRKLTA